MVRLNSYLIFSRPPRPMSLSPLTSPWPPSWWIPGSSWFQSTDLTCALMLEASPCTLNCIDLMVNFSLSEYCFLIFAFFHILVAEHPGDGGVKLPEAVLSAKKVQFDAFRLTGFVDFIRFGLSNLFLQGWGPCGRVSNLHGLYLQA